MFWRILRYGPCRPAHRGHKKDQKELRKLLSGGVQQVRVVLRALALLQLAKGSARRVSRRCCLTPQAIRKVGHRYEEAVSNGRSMRRSGPERRRCWRTARSNASSPWSAAIRPEGCARWTVRLVAEEAVKRRLVPRVGRETIRVLLLHHDLKPWREKNVVRGRTQ